MTTTTTPARLILCSVIASTTFAIIASDLRSEWRIGHAAVGSTPLRLPADATHDLPVAQTWAEITNVPDPGMNTGG